MEAADRRSGLKVYGYRPKRCRLLESEYWDTSALQRRSFIHPVVLLKVKKEHVHIRTHAIS